jgi:dTDP-4-dehydrorhamnose 3,5-epimerase
VPIAARPTPIAGVLELVGQPFSDHRGAFFNAFRAPEPAFAQGWGDRAIAQVNLSRTETVGAVPAQPRVGCGGGPADRFAQLGPVARGGALARRGQRLADSRGLCPRLPGAGAR